MKYEELDIFGKIWYFTLCVPVLLFIAAVTLIVASFALLAKLSKFIKLSDAFSAWFRILADGFTKKVKNARTRKED